MKKLPVLFLILIASTHVFSQGTLSGDLKLNLNFFQRDTNIKASDNPLYDNYLSGGEAWLNLRYSNNGYTFFVRADAFNNSNLKNPTSAMSDFGLGAWGVTKDFNDLSISVGSIYDQIGSGILFRAWEDRALLIDNALFGIELKYKLSEQIMLKGFTGQQKNNNAVNNVRYKPIIKGFNAEGDFSVGKAHILPGVGVLNRTLDGESYSAVVATIVADTVASHRFTPVHNMYAFCVYNTFTLGNFSWYIEGDYKTRDAIYVDNLLVNKPGDLQYTSANFGVKGIALSVSGKRTNNFVMRTSPKEVLLNGMLNRQPVVSIQRPERLMARYTPPSQDISEMAGTANLTISPNDVTNFNVTYTHVNTLADLELYREAYVDGVYQGMKSWILHGGIQYLRYNIQVYQVRPAPIQTAITPFVEITYKLSDNKSLRAEVQYMSAEHDYGSWAFALLEYNIAPTWSIAVSDMYNVSPNKGTDNPTYTGPGFTPKSNHYYNVFVAYSKGPHRFTLAYVKQVDGINCTGGVCRYEPAFSGVKATVQTTF